MKELMMNEDFADVTLVTEDKKQIKANTNILSACSPVFKDILKKEKNSNHIMYLRGIQFPEMESIVQFIYLGEATFNEERMDEFLAVAKMLEIEELCNADLETNDEPDDEHLRDPVTPIVKIEEQTDEIINQGQKERIRDKSTLTKRKRSVHEGVKYACNQCDYNATKQSHLTAHIQSMHDGVMFACDLCDQQFKWRSMLKTHIKIRHDAEANGEPDDFLTPTRKMEEQAVVYNPEPDDSVTPTKDVEDQSFVSNDNPKPAPKEIEEGLNRKYECGQCHKMFSFPSALCRHKQSVHRGVKHFCDQCEHQFTEPWGLKRHIQSKHAGIKYACDQCDIQYSQKNTLRMHIKNKHEA